jgi:hypothetical protein
MPHGNLSVDPSIHDHIKYVNVATNARDMLRGRLKPNSLTEKIEYRQYGTKDDKGNNIMRQVHHHSHSVSHIGDWLPRM